MELFRWMIAKMCNARRTRCHITRPIENGEHTHTYINIQIYDWMTPTCDNQIRLIEFAYALATLYAF